MWESIQCASKQFMLQWPLFSKKLDDALSERRNKVLRFCCLCKREIVYGRDIYMYRGIQAFCSLDCRDQQITNDEKQERKNSKPKYSSSGVYNYYKRQNLRTKVTMAAAA
ncbi:hypothetical protein SELMODRAFT_429299 [Selaginella moellendorffii]|uniref:FLZ-type domain-containing protein n=1 Tax=Selaginella moellendorffii TaxID=88036 RepID=D8T5Q4_SELML|nr:hypothetical protein SELMODRAFT_429299 [Selaginella moellendorffii]